MEKEIRTIKTLLSFFAAILIIYLVSLLKGLLVPLAFAFFFAILLQPILAWFERKRWPFGLSLAVISIGSIILLWLIGMLFYETALNLVDEKDKLLEQINGKLDGISLWVTEMTGFSVDAGQFTDLISPLFSVEWFLESSGKFAGFLGNFTGTFIMTMLYLVLLLGGILKYEQYINYLEEGDMSKERKLLTGFEEVKSSIVTYMKVKFLMSLFTGLGFFLTCWIFGLDFAVFWGFLAFMLNFIPTIGSITATIPPALLGLVQLDSFGVIFIMIGILILVQFVFGNVVEPKLMGSSLALNTIVVILGLLLWGYIWGVPGMIMSVPLLVLTKVILAQNPSAQLIVRLMGTSRTTS